MSNILLGPKDTTTGLCGRDCGTFDCNSNYILPTGQALPASVRCLDPESSDEVRLAAFSYSPLNPSPTIGDIYDNSCNRKVWTYTGGGLFETTLDPFDGEEIVVQDVRPNAQSADARTVFNLYAGGTPTTVSPRSISYTVDFGGSPFVVTAEISDPYDPVSLYTTARDHLLAQDLATAARRFRGRIWGPDRAASKAAGDWVLTSQEDVVVDPRVSFVRYPAGTFPGFPSLTFVPQWATARFFFAEQEVASGVFGLGVTMRRQWAWLRNPCRVYFYTGQLYGGVQSRCETWQPDCAQGVYFPPPFPGQVFANLYEGFVYVERDRVCP